MTTVNKEEIQKFSKIADEWWDTKGKFKPLHVFNPTRIKYIKENSLQNAENKRIIKPDEKLMDLLESGENEITYFNLQKYMNKHFIKE